MAIGKMQANISIKSYSVTTDEDGFGSLTGTTKHTVRAYKEERTGSESWTNDARFANVSVVFTFRFLADVVASDIIEDGGESFEILFVEHTKGNGLWVQAYCRKVEASG